jgi:hypothetical protein
LVYLLFEAKVGARTHEDQLTTYAKALDEWLQEHAMGTARLFVMAPQRQVSAIVTGAKPELSEAGMGHFAPIGVSWEQIATLFQELQGQTNDSRLAVHLEQFAKIVFHRLEELSRPFTLEESQLLEDPLSARAIRRAKLVVDKTREQLITLRGFTCTADAGSEYDGHWVKYGARGWWYGIWTVAWDKVGRSPIFLQLSGLANRPLPSVREGLANPVEIQLGRRTDWVVPLVIREGVEPETLASEHAETIRRYAMELPESGEALKE